MSKFDARARKATFLGFKDGTNGYILYDLNSHNIFVSRHVIFYETNFPFKPSTYSISPSNLEPDNSTITPTLKYLLILALLTSPTDNQLILHLHHGECTLWWHLVGVVSMGNMHIKCVLCMQNVVWWWLPRISCTYRRKLSCICLLKLLQVPLLFWEFVGCELWFSTKSWSLNLTLVVHIKWGLENHFLFIQSSLFKIVLRYRVSFSYFFSLGIWFASLEWSTSSFNSTCI